MAQMKPMYNGTNYPDRFYGYAATLDEARTKAKAVSDERDLPMYIYKADELSPEKRFYILDDGGHSHMIAGGRRSEFVEEVG